MRRLHADILLLVTAAIWGLAFVFQKTAMDHVGPLTFIAARAVVGALALAPLAWLEHRRAAVPLEDPAGLLRFILWGGLFFFLGAAFQQVGLKTATVTNAGFLTSLYVVMTPIAAWGLSHRRPNPVVWPAAALSFAGTWLLSGGRIEALSTGDALVAVSAIFWALHVVMTEGAGRHARPVLYTASQFAVIFAIAAACAMPTETITLAGLAAAWPSIAYVGLLSSAVTFTLFSIAVRYTPASEATVIASTESLFAAAAGAWFLGERLPPIGWIGAVLILTAVVMVQMPLRRGSSA
jgi:drug/metabolite transporter (DMT)-like permease